jgi:hypothetical protein
MTNKNYHFRSNYVLLFNQLCKECKDEALCNENIELISNTSLLFRINYLLLKLGLEGFTESELNTIKLN